MRTNRYRRDQRQLEEEEEMWFNEEEDFNEVVPQHKTDLDTTLGNYKKNPITAYLKFSIFSSD